MDELPIDIIREIMKYLEYRDFQACLCVSKCFSEVFSRFELVIRKYGDLPDYELIVENRDISALKEILSVCGCNDSASIIRYAVKRGYHDIFKLMISYDYEIPFLILKLLEETKTIDNEVRLEIIRMLYFNDAHTGGTEYGIIKTCDLPILKWYYSINGSFHYLMKSAIETWFAPTVIKNYVFGRCHRLICS